MDIEPNVEEMWAAIKAFHDKAELVQVIRSSEQGASIWGVYRGRSRSDAFVGVGVDKQAAIRDAYSRLPKTAAPAVIAEVETAEAGQSEPCNYYNHVEEARTQEGCSACRLAASAKSETRTCKPWADVKADISAKSEEQSEPGEDVLEPALKRLLIRRLMDKYAGARRWYAHTGFLYFGGDRVGVGATETTALMDALRRVEDKDELPREDERLAPAVPLGFALLAVEQRESQLAAAQERIRELEGALKTTQSVLIAEFGNRMYEVNFAHIDAALRTYAAAKGEGK